MSKAVLAAQRLADHDDNWRRPRSPALNIPPAPDAKGQYARAGAITAPDAASARNSSRNHANTNHRAMFGGHFSNKRASSLERGAKDPAANETWRPSQTTSSAEPGRSLIVGSLGSHLAQRRHAAFHAASNASEVARRAFVATEIGSVGSSGRTMPAHLSNGHTALASASIDDPSRLSSPTPPRHLRVEGFDTTPTTRTDTAHVRPTTSQDEDWALTPTSSLPSLPSSPRRPDADTLDWHDNDAMDARLVSPQGTMGNLLAKRIESHDALTGAARSPRMGSALHRAQLHAASPRPTPLSRDARDAANNSPHRGPRTANHLGNPIDRIAAHQRVTNPSPRRGSDILSRFRHTLDPPQSPRSFESSPRLPSMRPGASSPALPPSRRDSSSSLASHRHTLHHSRRDSSSSQLSSASLASIASSRPLYGVYRPPHLRNRTSNIALQAGIAHYDRVRTPSLRGMVRSPEPPSRPGSTVPHRSFLGPGIPEESQFSTPVAKEQRSHDEEPQGEGIDGGRQPDGMEADYFSLSPARHEATSPSVVSFSSGHDAVPADPPEAKEEEDFDLSHEDMLQTKTSLTDSYCLSRRSSMLSSFQIGNGVPVVDIFQVGDRLGPGMIHDGYPITIAETSTGFSKQQSDVTGTRLEVMSKLGEGSYAVVYLVQEIAGDDQIIVGAKDDANNFTQRGQPIAQLDHEEEGDATLGDATIAGTLRARQRVSHSRSRFDEDDFSSTLKADADLSNDSFARRVAAAEDAERTAQLQHPAGIDQPQEGRQFALKCLCKRDLSEDMLEVQRLEATIHQSIPPHKNIVTLYRTYETPEWLFLVLEYCPGQDLFYWLEQARDTAGSELARARASAAAAAAATTKAAGSLSPSASSRRGDQSPDGTPPSPSLLATTSMDALLSRKRLRLISKMFRQMCDSVQFCHDRGIAHRDIKPENFIVEDRRGIRSSDDDEDVESLADVEDASRDGSMDRGRASGLVRPSSNLRRVSTASVSTTYSSESSTAPNANTDVVVKLTDFGLATAEPRCADFDCGSKPYMAYECRNNITSTYDPQQADIWSLGIVLLNLIFHRSPFREPNLDRCESFRAFCYDPIGFLTESFEGLSEEVAVFLSENVLCNIVTSLQEAAEGREPTKRRTSAREFGQWAKTLPARFGLQANETRKRLTRGYSLDLTSPLIHSRAGSNSSTLPSMLSSPQPYATSLVIEEDDDNGYGQHSLFPEYDGNGADEAVASPTPGAHQTARPWPPKGTDSPDILPSPSFSPPPSAGEPASPRPNGKAVKENGAAAPDTKTGARLAPPKLVVHAHDDVGTGWASATSAGNGDFAFGNWSADGPGGKWHHGGEFGGKDGSSGGGGGKDKLGPNSLKFPRTMSPQQATPGGSDPRQISALAKMLEKERLSDKQRVPSWRAHRERRESRR